MLRRFWKWGRGLDAGDGVRKLQSQPILRVGGIALYVSFTLAFLIASNPEKAGYRFWTGPSSSWDDHVPSWLRG